MRSKAQVHPKFRLDFVAQPHEIDWPSGLDSGEVRAALQVSFFLAKNVCRVSSSPGLSSNEKIEFPGESVCVCFGTDELATEALTIDGIH